jgi:hypothetical protein
LAARNSSIVTCWDKQEYQDGTTARRRESKEEFQIQPDLNCGNLLPSFGMSNAKFPGKMLTGSAHCPYPRLPDFLGIR